MSRTDRAQAVVPGSPEDAFAALVDASAREQWLPPAGMTGRFTWFDARPGGGYRMELTYDEPDTVGKTHGNTDVVDVRFTEVDRPARLVEEADFVSDDPAFAGTMTMTWSLEDVEDGTRVTITADGVPDGISEADHLSAFASTLSGLADYLASRESRRP